MTPEAASTPYERAVWRVGLGLLGAALAIGVGLAVWLPHAPAAALWAVPAALLVALAAPVAVRALPTWRATPLLGVLGLFAVVSGHSEEVRPEEIAFAGAHVAFLAWWFWTRVFVYRERVVRDRVDAALLAFLVYAVGSLGLTVVFGGELVSGLGEVFTLSILALYFPLREAFADGDRGQRLAVLAVLFFGVVGAFRILLSLRSALSDAEYAWEIARGRVPLNETFVYMASLLSLCLAVIGRRRTAALAGAAAVFLLALIMTQWRAYYVAWAVALGAVALWAGSGNRRRVGLLLLATGAAGAVAAFVLLGEGVVLAALGIADRILSIGTAGTQDISLMNRFLEFEALWPVLMESPVFGHGPGVDFSFYDAIYDATWTKSYAHNTYLILWFKYGLVGLALFSTVWVASVARGLRARREGPPRHRALGLFVAASLLGLTVSSLVSVAIVNDDSAFTFTLLFAVGAAVRPERGPPT